MRVSFGLPIAMLALLSLPAAGQDIFQPLREMVQSLQPDKPPARPRQVVPDEAPPIPRERPADLGGPSVPTVAEPAKPDVPEVARPVPPEVPTVAQPGVNLPRPRPEEPVEAPKPEAQPAEETVPPAAEGVPEQVTPPAVEGVPEQAAPQSEAEPGRVFQTACPAMVMGQVEAKALPPISDGQCKAQSPLSVTGVLVNGRMVPFNTEAVTDCGLATALPDWISEVDNYVKAHDDTQIQSVTVGTGYMCRNVNNAAEGNLSFHAFADALDVVGFKLEDGRNVTVEQGWTGTEEQGSRIVKFAHDAACGHFTTTLGPEANALHHDHIHVDLGCHGKSCTARLCE